MARNASQSSKARSKRRRESTRDKSRMNGSKGRTVKAKSTSARRSKAAARAKRKRSAASAHRTTTAQQSARERIVDTPKSALSILKRDHNELRHMLGELESAQSPDKRERLLDQIEREVQRHSRVEEEIVYPAFKEAVRNKTDEHLFYEAREEHHVVDLVLPEIKREEPASECFAAKAKVLKDLIEHHAMEEENEMFPRMRHTMSGPELEQLGEEVQRRKEELETSWNPIKAVTALVTGE